MPPEMPPVGATVQWFEGATRGSQPAAAVVTGHGMGSALCLAVLPPNSHTFQVRDGVKHIDSPDIRDDERHDAGAWDCLPGRQPAAPQPRK
jgi:hypothetical protein